MINKTYVKKSTHTLVSIFCLLSLSANADNLITYDVPKKALYTHHNDDFTVRVREVGGQWRDLYEYNVKVDLDNPQNASMVYFDMDGTVELTVKKNNGDLSRVEVRPASAHVKTKTDGNSIKLTLNKPTNISIEFNGDRKHNLHVFANPIEKNPPKQDDPDVIWFGPGIHVPPEAAKGSFIIPSNKTVYIAGGSLVQGKIDVRGAENVKILGHGIIDRAERGFEITKSNNVVIDGPIVVNPNHYTVYCGQSTHLSISNIKTFSAAPWSDGIDMMSCSDVKIDNVFLRTSDDSIAIYGHRWDFYGDAKNISISNSVLWADVAHPINIGIHGSDKAPEVIENITFKNIDVLEHDEDDRNYQGVMAITNGDNNLVRNVLFENIRIDSVEEGMLFNIRSVYNEKYSSAPGREVENIIFKNISAKSTDMNRSVISGYAEDRSINNVTFTNVKIDGKDLKVEDIDIGDFVKDVKIKK